MLFKNHQTLNLSEEILQWYDQNARDLPWRNTKNPYHIWISEIILQQTQVKQGLGYYLRFIARFPDVQTLSNAPVDEVLLLWKGLGYYSRALNLHQASKQIVEKFDGKFPSSYTEILSLKGVGKYTAAAIASISFEEKIPAIDGNFYRVLSRIFADSTDISTASAFQHFSLLALKIMPDYRFGDFNQAIMDIGAEVCKPQKPLCEECPAQRHCVAFSRQMMEEFPVKTKKVKAKPLALKYFFVQFEDKFLIKQRDDSFIWKFLYEFPTEIPTEWEKFFAENHSIQHQLTHLKLQIDIQKVLLLNVEMFEKFAQTQGFMIASGNILNEKSFPKPLEDFILKFLEEK